jgi:glycosyltransferase involved in cell wall biosynthesis
VLKEVVSVNDNKKVSVIIPTYRRPEALKRAVCSVLTQTYKNLELIVVDDNNPGDEYRIETERVMSEFNDARLKYLKHEMNRNGAAARNTGIRYSTGIYITFLDDDDEFLPDRILNQVNKMEVLDDSWASCYTSYKKLNKSGKIQYGYETREGWLLTEALMRNLYIGSGSNLFLRKSVVEEIGGFDESFIRNQDLELLVRILGKYKLAYIDDCSLIVHYEIRYEKRTYEQLKEIDKYYLNKFNCQINKLNEKDKEKVYTMITLDSFRNAFSSRNFAEGIGEIFIKKVNIITFIRYILYLINRIATNKSYGFKM